MNFGLEHSWVDNTRNFTRTNRSDGNVKGRESKRQQHTDLTKINELCWKSHDPTGVQYLLTRTFTPEENDWYLQDVRADPKTYDPDTVGGIVLMTAADSVTEVNVTKGQVLDEVCLEPKKTRHTDNVPQTPSKYKQRQIGLSVTGCVLSVNVRIDVIIVVYKYIVSF